MKKRSICRAGNRSGFLRKLVDSYTILEKERVSFNFWKLFGYLVKTRMLLLRILAVGAGHEALELHGPHVTLEQLIDRLHSQLESVFYLRRRTQAPVGL
jgi:hypothetical protein